MKFLCDDNLGKLARYLLMMGYDTYFDSEISDPKLLSLMLKDKRFVLTRDSKILPRLNDGEYLLIESDNPDEQIAAVIKYFNLQPSETSLFSRCLECNIPCEEVTAESVKDKVFPYILKTKDRFQRCPECGRIYWQGSHYKEMADKLKAILKS